MLTTICLAAVVLADSLSTYSVPATDASVHSFGSFPTDDSAGSSSAASTYTLPTLSLSSLSSSVMSTHTASLAGSSTVSSKASNGTVVPHTATSRATLAVGNGAAPLVPIWALLF